MPKMLKLYPKNKNRRLPSPGGQPLSTYHHPSRPRSTPGGHRSFHHKFYLLFTLDHRHRFQPQFSFRHHRNSTRHLLPGELRPAHHLLTIRVFFPFFLSCRCCHRAQALEYKFHHLRRRRAPARPASTPSLHQLRRRTSRTTRTTRTLDSTTPETFLTTRASPHRHSGLSSHRADSKFFLHLHSSTPSFFIRNRHIRRR